LQCNDYDPPRWSSILIFVSLSERYARIIANQQVANRVSEAEWRLALDAPIDHVRTGRIGEGFISCFSRPQPTPQSMEAFLYW